jgi:hypothetical protein
MNINRIASKIDIGLVLAEVSQKIITHEVVVDKESGTIDVRYSRPSGLKDIKFKLRIAKHETQMVD